MFKQEEKGSPFISEDGGNPENDKNKAKSEQKQAKGTVMLEDRAITATDCPEEMDAWICYEVVQRGVSMVAIDCEWLAPWFRRNGEPEKVCLVQVATEKACLLAHVYKLEALPPNMAAVLANKEVVKAGVNVGGDASRLKRDFDVSTLGLHDLSISDPKAKSLKKLAKKHLKKDMDKASGLVCSNWLNWPLDECQMQYAALDACLTYDVYAKGPAWLRKKQGPKVEEEKEGKDADAGAAAAAGPAGGEAPALQRSQTEPAGGASNDKKNNHFFVMMRNKSVGQPNRGRKEHPEGARDALEGLTFVVSGVLDSFDRKECWAYIQRHGGSIKKSITKAVTHILNDHGEVGPKKAQQAQKWGIPIVGEDFLLDMVAKSALN
uniref:3'-5' exonuclease n=1 Tax=Fibrocapsa japonica TaxID=94617 RepID=A0A7S2UXF5_9STRA